jgi:hypothetical protein
MTCRRGRWDPSAYPIGGGAAVPDFGRRVDLALLQRRVIVGAIGSLLRHDGSLRPIEGMGRSLFRDATP